MTTATRRNWVRIGLLRVKLWLLALMSALPK